MNDDIQIYKKLLEIRTEELLKYRNFVFSTISKAYMSNKSDKEFREWFNRESARILPSLCRWEMNC